MPQLDPIRVKRIMVFLDLRGEVKYNVDSLWKRGPKAEEVATVHGFRKDGDCGA